MQKVTGKESSALRKSLLTAAWARAADSRRSDSILRDDLSAKLMEQVELSGESVEADWMRQVAVPIRSAILDESVRGFLARHPDGLVINLGAGFDTRFARLDNGRVRWVEVDAPEVIRAKQKLFAPTERFRYIAAQPGSREWIVSLAGDRGPAMVVAEGVLSELEQRASRDLFVALVERFGDLEVALDVIAPFRVKTGARIAYDRPRAYANAHDMTFAVESDPADAARGYELEVLGDWSIFDRHRTRWRWARFFTSLTLIKRWMPRVLHVRLTSRQPARNVAA